MPAKSTGELPTAVSRKTVPQVDQPRTVLMKVPAIAPPVAVVEVAAIQEVAVQEAPAAVVLPSEVQPEISTPPVAAAEVAAVPESAYRASRRSRWKTEAEQTPRKSKTAWIGSLVSTSCGIAATCLRVLNPLTWLAIMIRSKQGALALVLLAMTIVSGWALISASMHGDNPSHDSVENLSLRDESKSSSPAEPTSIPASSPAPMSQPADAFGPELGPVIQAGNPIQPVNYQSTGAAHPRGAWLEGTIIEDEVAPTTKNQ